MPSKPSRLRLFHEGFASIRVEHPTRWLRFDSITSDDQAIHIPTGTPLAPIDGIESTIRANDRPTVVAPPRDLQALEEIGLIDGHMVPTVISGISIRTQHAEAPPAHEIPGPRQLVRQWIRRRYWNPQPRVIELSFGDGSRLVHLGCNLHRDTSSKWLEEALQSFKGADWLLVGMAQGEAESLLNHLPAFEARVVLVTDLVNDARRKARLPVKWLTPTVDQLQELGVPAYPFPPQSSMCFEGDEASA